MSSKELMLKRLLNKIDPTLAIGICFVVLSIPIVGYTTDDAYISFRYSRNLAHGLGLVFNPGERVEGYTNFLWVLLLAPFTLLSLPIEIPAKILGGLSSIGTLVLLVKMSDRLRESSTPRALNYLAATLTLTTVPFMLHSFAGMETSLFTFLVLFGTYLTISEQQRGIFGWSGFVYFLAALTRPEGCLFWLISSAYRLLQMPVEGRAAFVRAYLKWICTFALPGVLYFSFRYLYFAQLLPNTFVAKTGDGSRQLEGGLTYLSYFFQSTSPFGYLILPFVLLNAFRSTSQRKAFSFILATLVIYLIYLVGIGGDWMKLFRFMHLAIPLIAMLFYMSIVAFLHNYLDRDASAGFRRLCVDIFCLVAIVVFPWQAAAHYLRDLKEVRDETDFWNRSAGKVSRWLAANGKPGATISMGDIGEIGYRTRFNVIDQLGLVTPYISHLKGGYTEKEPTKVAKYIIDQQPEYILLISIFPVVGSQPKVHHQTAVEMIKYPQFVDNYQTFFMLRVTDSPHYWIVMRHKAKTKEHGLGTNLSHDFEGAVVEGWEAIQLPIENLIIRTERADARLGITGFQGERGMITGGTRMTRITSDTFPIDREQLCFLHASGEASDKLSVSLMLDDQVPFKVSAEGNRESRRVCWDLTSYRGKEARIVVDDGLETPEGFIAVDYFRLLDRIETPESK